MESASTCTLCPRRCAIDRTQARGVCGGGNEVRLTRAALHFWGGTAHQRRIRKWHGVLLGLPALRCVYCQNKSIARGEVGRGVSIERLAHIFLEQQERGALNINLVTPTHFTTQIKAALDLAQSDAFSDTPLVLPSSTTRAAARSYRPLPRLTVMSTSFSPTSSTRAPISQGALLRSRLPRHRLPRA